MRRSQDLPVDRPRRRVTGRGILIALGGLFLFVLVFGRAIARFYIDFLWHEALGRDDVFWGVIGAKLTLFFGFFAIFAILAGVNLFVADRSAPEAFPANVHPYVERFHEVFGRRLRLIRYVAAILFALMLALPAVGRWQDWLLFRNAKNFGVSDAQFGLDVGFYVFQLPFLTFLLDWLFAAVIIVLLLTIAAHILNGGVVFVSPMPVIRPATKTHIAVLLALLALLKAGDYWLDRYELTNSQRGIVEGATYSVVNAQIPALMLLILIAILTAGLYFWVARSGSFRYALIASALWLVVSIVGGVIYPAVVQGLVVNPNQEEREAEFIERNVLATRQAYGLAEVDVREIAFEDITANDVDANIESIENARLLNPALMKNRFVFDRGEEAGLTIDDLDVDRYSLDGDDPEQVLVAALELDLDSVPNKSWQGRHLINTRGCGLVLAPAGAVQPRGQRPIYTDAELSRPELYFSPSLTSYAITKTSSSERECGTPGEYDGDSGVVMSSFVRRAAFALAFLEYNVLGSGSIDRDSQMLWVRSVNDRLSKLAPFLSYDADPYPVELDGRVVWVVDAYTTTGRYPYSESLGKTQLSTRSGLSSGDNYVRNSVKVVVDAYTGDATFYVVDPEDPIIRAWRSAFPDLFTSLDEMPEGLREHLRYPEDLFRVQTDRYSKYRIAPELFFAREGAWSVAQAPGISPTSRNGGAPSTNDPATAATDTFAQESDAERFVPYYTYFDTAPGDQRDDEFVIFRPFVEFSTADQRTQLQAYMTASSEPDTYGQLISYVVEKDESGQLPDGPLRVASSAESTEEISRRISLDNTEDGGSEVRFGDLQTVPVGDGLVYVRPYYVSVPQESSRITETTEFRAVIVTYNENSVLSSTVDSALAELFPGYEGGLSGQVPTDSDGTPTVPTVTLDDDAEDVLLQLDTVLAEAESALEDGDLGLYQEKVQEAQSLTDEAIQLLGLDALTEEPTSATDASSDDDSDSSSDSESGSDESAES
jgi:uncharacterized membrane protein (UPF0182 family)